MTPEERDGRLHDALEAQVLRQPGATVELLAHRIRRATRDATVTDNEVEQRVDRSPLLVGLPDGGVTHLGRVLEGSILTQRVRAATKERTDLWTTLALAPITMLARDQPLLLAGGGELRASAFGHPALVGPLGWLPEVRPWELLALELRGGKVHIAALPEADLGDVTRQQRAKEVIAHHYRRERWFDGSDDLESRPAEVVNALALALLEDPGIFAEPLPPLDELLHDALEDQHHFHWRDFEASRQAPSVSFAVRGMPEALHVELEARARRYGMSLDQYVIAVLGHLAWRTPFAEDMQPWDDWDPDGPGLAVVLAHRPR